MAIANPGRDVIQYDRDRKHQTDEADTARIRQSTCYTPPIKVDYFLLINSFLPAWAAAEGTGAGRVSIPVRPDLWSCHQKTKYGVDRRAASAVFSRAPIHHVSPNR